MHIEIQIEMLIEMQHRISSEIRAFCVLRIFLPAYRQLTIREVNLSARCGKRSVRPPFFF